MEEPGFHAQLSGWMPHELDRILAGINGLKTHRWGIIYFWPRGGLGAKKTTNKSFVVWFFLSHCVKPLHLMAGTLSGYRTTVMNFSHHPTSTTALQLCSKSSSLHLILVHPTSPYIIFTSSKPAKLIILVILWLFTFCFTSHSYLILTSFSLFNSHSLTPLYPTTVLT